MPLMPTILGPLFVLVFTLSQAFRDVYFGSVFQRFDFFVVLALAFILSTVIFGVIALIRAPDDFRKLRGQGRTVIAVNLTTALAWSSYFFALTYVDPSIVNTIHSAMGPLVVVVLGAFGVKLAQRTGTGGSERIGYVGIGLSVVALWVVVLTGHAGLAQGNPYASIAGLALLTVSGTSITISLLYCKRLQDSGIGADALTTVRYAALIVFAALMIWLRDTPAATPSQLGVLAAASLVLLILPLYSLQVGIGRTSPLTANIVRALSPVLVFALEQFDGRMRYSLPVLVCILIYSASVILSNVARGWRDQPAAAVTANR